MKINDWDRLASDTKTLEFHFPGLTSQHYEMINFQSWDDPRILSPGANRKPLQSNVIHSNMLNEDVIRIESSKLQDFGGIIEFTWINGLQKIGFERYKMSAQFGAIETPNFNLKHTSKFKVSLACPASFDIPTQVPQPVGQKSLGGASIYWFEIDPAKTVLSMVFDDTYKARWKEILLIVFSTVLGIGFTLGVEQVLALSKGNASEDDKKSKTQRKNKARSKRK